MGKRISGRKLIPVFLVAALFSWIYWRDLETFVLPAALLVRLYTYTSAFLLLAAILLMYLRLQDRKNLPENSNLRNKIRLLLGSFWIIDGLLQIQPQMPFGFSHFVLYNSLLSLPVGVSGNLSFLISAWNSHEVILDAFSASVQLFLGIALITSRSRKVAAAVAIMSTIWALGIWVVGEGMGGILQPGLSLISGFPGAALLYAVMGVMISFRRGENITRRAAYTVLGSILTVGGIIQAIPYEGFWTQNGIATIPGVMILNPQPEIISSTLFWFASTLSANWIFWNLFFILAFVGLGTLWFTVPRYAGIGTVILMGFVWIFGQDFGIFGMYGTDLNTALPFLLFALVASYSNFGTKREVLENARPDKSSAELVRAGN